MTTLKATAVGASTGAGLPGGHGDRSQHAKSAGLIRRGPILVKLAGAATTSKGQVDAALLEESDGPRKG